MIRRSKIIFCRLLCVMWGEENKIQFTKYCL